ncbi:hypothetical protein XENOCAPTIV_023233, partial [Xenoophorus captivus]
LEQQTVSGRVVCALHYIWGVSVSCCAAVHLGQRNQLRGASQRLHRSSYRSVENHQGYGYGLQVLVMAALSSVRLLRVLQFIVRGTQRLVLLGTQHALWLLVNLW